jgi:tetratricopeptide (TPR) repeat protein
MADCERALGRPQTALKLAKESHRYDLDPALQIEMIIVESGARSDLGQHAEARRLLAAAVDRFHGGGETLRPARARLFYAYAESLLGADRTAEARQAFATADSLDPDQENDAAARVDELDGLVIDYDDADDETEDQAGDPAEDPTGE